MTDDIYKLAEKELLEKAQERRKERRKEVFTDEVRAGMKTLTNRQINGNLDAAASAASKTGQILTFIVAIAVFPISATAILAMCFRLNSGESIGLFLAVIAMLWSRWALFGEGPESK